MSQEAWEQIKRSKGFNVKIYRKLSTVLILLFAINIALSAWVFYEYLKRPEPHYYATSGITPPIELNPLNQANSSPDALLPEEEPSGDQDKVMPT